MLVRLRWLLARLTLGKDELVVALQLIVLAEDICQADKLTLDLALIHARVVLDQRHVLRLIRGYREQALHIEEVLVAIEHFRFFLLLLAVFLA